jgi:hypothetical protein
MNVGVLFKDERELVLYVFLLLVRLLSCILFKS